MIHLENLGSSALSRILNSVISAVILCHLNEARHILGLRVRTQLGTIIQIAIRSPNQSTSWGQRTDRHTAVESPFRDIKIHTNLTCYVMMSCELDLINKEEMESSLDAQGSGLEMHFLVLERNTMLTGSLQTQRQNSMLENTGPTYL